mmetsp:Transcript_70777/g.160093  ORF Transcript_70777/g.160093 Transcript_70777/m.160093 type:complete len:218 (+) Transcript_70777:73-726(+)
MGESEGGPLTLHVEGLTRSVGAVHLADIFSTYGEVSKCSVEKDKRTGLSKGFGYVEFTKREAAEIAQRYLDGAIIDGFVFISSIASFSHFIFFKVTRIFICSQVIKASIILIKRRRRSHSPRSDKSGGRRSSDRSGRPSGRGRRSPSPRRTRSPRRRSPRRQSTTRRRSRSRSRSRGRAFVRSRKSSRSRSSSSSSRSNSSSSSSSSYDSRSSRSGS